MSDLRSTRMRLRNNRSYLRQEILATPVDQRGSTSNDMAEQTHHRRTRVPRAPRAPRTPRMKRGASRSKKQAHGSGIIPRFEHLQLLQSKDTIDIYIGTRKHHDLVIEEANRAILAYFVPAWLKEFSDSVFVVQVEPELAGHVQFVYDWMMHNGDLHAATMNSTMFAMLAGPEWLKIYRVAAWFELSELKTQLETRITAALDQDGWIPAPDTLVYSYYTLHASNVCRIVCRKIAEILHSPNNNVNVAKYQQELILDKNTGIREYIEHLARVYGAGLIEDALKREHEEAKKKSKENAENQKRKQANGNGTAGSGNGLRLAILTYDERVDLVARGGCVRCRELGHGGANCPRRSLSRPLGPDYQYNEISGCWERRRAS